MAKREIKIVIIYLTAKENKKSRSIIVYLIASETINEGLYSFILPLAETGAVRVDHIRKGSELYLLFFVCLFVLKRVYKGRI